MYFILILLDDLENVNTLKTKAFENSKQNSPQPRISLILTKSLALKLHFM